MEMHGSSDVGSSTAPRRRRRSGLAAGLCLLLLLGVGLVACAGSGSGGAGQDRATGLVVAQADSFMADLAGAPFANLSQGQRWRAVASLGTGLPPSGFETSDLPEPESTGPGLLHAYCTQCHWLPTPQMHSAGEWPILLRRMGLRMQVLEHRVSGPLLDRVGGESLEASVMYRSLPSEAEMDTLTAYLTRNALPVASPGELPSTAEAGHFVDECSSCHETPSPTAHTAAAWDDVLTRMQENMRKMRVDTLSTRDMDRIRTFLQAHASRPAD